MTTCDYNLLEFGDGVVIGDAVHVSGHTVEAGVVKTARVRLGPNVTIGLCSVIEIGVEIGADAQVGALSFVPKYTRLPGGVVYVGAPATLVE
jgi:carbonic anhydrase/acetyltransferase-like protein (isoleucine patch superfamily)